MSTANTVFKKSPSLPQVEIRQATNSSACYATHSHDEFSFGVIDTGTALYKNLSHEEQISTLDVVTINPGDAHSCNPKTNDWSYRMLFVEADYFSELQHDIFNIEDRGYLPFSSHLSNNIEARSQFNDLFTALCQHEPLHAESLLLEFIANEFSSNKTASIPDTFDVSNISRVKDMITASLGQNLPLESFAKEAGLSRYHLIRSFKKKYGQSPHAFQLDQRIKKSKKMLQAGESLLNVSHLLGFADQSHFQRHFKRRIAITPLQYQRSFQDSMNN